MSFGKASIVLRASVPPRDGGRHPAESSASSRGLPPHALTSPVQNRRKMAGTSGVAVSPVISPSLRGRHAPRAAPGRLRGPTVSASRSAWSPGARARVALGDGQHRVVGPEPRSSSAPSAQRLHALTFAGRHREAFPASGATRSALLATSTAATAGNSVRHRSRTATGVPAGSTRITTSAPRTAAFARSMPRASTRPAASPRPAVSTQVTVSPSRSPGASSTSRVVPGAASTSARSSPTSRLKRVDFPAFTGPARTTRAPRRSIRPRAAVERSAATTPRAAESRPGMPASTSAASSGKSSSASRSRSSPADRDPSTVSPSTPAS
jgi:hypothetical protein